MVRRTARLSLLLLAAGSFACASGGTSAAPTANNNTRAARSPDLITSQEIANAQAANAYDLVVRLRPQWFRSNGVASIGGGARSGAVVAYLDNVRLSRVEDLRGISAGGITSIRYLNAERASSLPNSGGLVAGAVVVSTKSN